MSKFNSQFAQYMEDMVELRVALGYAEKTYTPRLRELDCFIRQNHAHADTFSKELVLEWLKRRDGESNTNREMRAGIARMFGEYLTSVGCEAYVLPKNFIRGKKRFTPYMMTDTELTSFFAEVDKLKNTSADILRRSTASVMLRLIYTCGLRPGEGLRLKTKNVNLDTGEILITETKLHKERIVVMHEDMQKLMKKYAVKAALAGRENTFFFPDSNGNPHTAYWLDGIVKSCFQRAHPEAAAETLPMVRAYDLRHRFASATLCRWLDEGRNLYNMLPYLRVYMGHKTLAQTAYYIHILPENLLKSKGIDWDKLNDVIPEAEEWDE